MSAIGDLALAVAAGCLVIERGLMLAQAKRDEAAARRLLTLANVLEQLISDADARRPVISKEQRHCDGLGVPRDNIFFLGPEK